MNDTPVCAATGPAQFALAVHGGAGTISRDRLGAGEVGAYHEGLRRALAVGRRILAQGGQAADAVTAAVVALEDDPLFNAGRGASLTSAGTFEMDAAVMDGRGRRAGAVAALLGPKNPVLAARAVMDHSPCVLLVGEGAAAFCRARGLAFAPPGYFLIEARRRDLDEALERRRRGLADPDFAAPSGTVGAVARDRDGHLAAATSTGGITGKPPGRVGDSPLIGAGTFADDATCAVSATGRGEFFIRWGAAFEVAARLLHRGETLDRAAACVVARLAQVGGAGGLIAADRDGRLALPFNTPGMYRGHVSGEGALFTAIWDEPYRAG